MASVEPALPAAAPTFAGAPPADLTAGPLRRDWLATLLLAPVAALLCLWWGLRPNFDLALYLQQMLLITLATGLPVVGLFTLVTIFRGEWQLARTRPVAAASLAGNLLLFAAMSWIYSHLKVGVLLGGNCDAWLHRIDCALMGGHEPWTLCRQIVPATFAPALHIVYMALLPVILATIIWFSLAGRGRDASRLTTAIVLAYYLGVLAYHLVPSYGPAFLVASASCDTLCPAAAGVQQLLVRHVGEALLHPETASIRPWCYIAAFPSLHLCHALIVTWYVRRNRLALVLLSLFTALTALATIYFGWHYLVDWLGGAAVAAVAIWLTERWAQDSPAVEDPGSGADTSLANA